MSAALVDQVAALKKAIVDGLVPQAEAVDLLVEWRDGGLTVLGAQDLLGCAPDWTR